MKFVVLVLLSLLAVPSAAVTIEQVISREDPKFDCAAAVLSVGRDGNVYLGSNANPGYVLRVSRDGKEMVGGDVVYALTGVTANAAGIIATSNAHFNHSINIYDAQFRPIAVCSEFLVNDQVQWDAPGRIETGKSGDFYGLDQHRDRIVRVNTSGKVVQVYPLPRTGNDRGHIYTTFRVCEAERVLDVMTYDGTVYAVGFGGEVRGKSKHPGENFAVDDAGVLYSVGPAGSVIKRDGPDGGPLKSIHLQRSGAAQGTEYPVTAIDVFGSDIVIKRASPTELFRVYDLNTGAEKTITSTRHERLTAEFPSLVWTAGQNVPLKISLESSPATGHAPPEWHAWATPLGDSDWRELKLSNGQFTVPSDWAGMYQLKIAPIAQPTGPCEYLLQQAVEVQIPDSHGTVSVWTPNNRVWFGRGDEVPLGVLLRAADGDQTSSIRLELRRGAGVVWSTDLALHANTVAQCKLGGEVTRLLADGRYQLVPVLSGYTCVTQPLKVGPGTRSGSPFRVMQYGDYSGFASSANVWDFADTAEQMLHKSELLGLNQYVNRATYYPSDFINNNTGRPLIRDLSEQLTKETSGTAPQKVEFGFPEVHALSAMGAYGVRELFLLVGMDGGLPLGTLYDKRTPEQFAAQVESSTKMMAGLQGFYGWTWAANWWADADRAYHSPDDKTKYEAALKRANDTGAWSPILDEIGDRRVHWQVDAQTTFKNALDKTTSHLTTASSGPYRRPEVYPPISFSNVDEVDLHYQAEQITTPDWTSQAVDYYQRPGKPTWIHPELFNDSGTGEQVLPMLWLPIMRGVGGIGASGNIPNWGNQPIDSRSGYAGLSSVFMAIDNFATRYGVWLNTLHNDDRVAIVVSSRQVKTDSWGGVGGQYFTRLWEAYQACLLAHFPATFLYTEDVTPETLKQFKALLLIGQRFEMEPPLAALLAQAKKDGVAILADETCRDSLVKDFTRLPVAFNQIEKVSGFNADYAFWQYPKILSDDAPIVARALAAIVPPVATVDQPRVLVSERRSGDAQAFWVVNDSGAAIDVGLLWRVGNGVSTCLPVVAHVNLPVEKGKAVYDVFEQREVSGDIRADLRYTDARLYVVLPQPIKRLKLHTNGDLKPGAAVHWSVSVPGIDTPLPMHLRLVGGGVLLDERFTTTGEGTLTVPANATEPLTLTATELISGQSVQVPANPHIETDDPKVVDAFGPRLRDLAVSHDGATVLINAFDWGDNLYAIDPATGKTRWQERIGHYFAYAPAAAADGFVAQGYDFKTGEGYHLYQLDSHGGVVRRFALDGLPARLTNWAFSPMFADRLNNFATASDGSWVASAGNLGLAVWSRDGKLLWSQDWSKTARQTRRLLAPDNQTLIVANGITLAAVDATTGKQAWSLPLAPAGEILGLTSSGDGKTIAARASSQSGRVFVVRAGTIVGALPTAADNAVLTSDGSRVAVTTGDQLKWYDATGGLRWVYNTEGVLRFVRISPDGRRIVGCTTMGDMDVFGAEDGELLCKKPLGVLGAPAWLPNGDLVVATWMGDVCRLDAHYHELWRVKMTGSPTDASSPSVADVPPDKTPTVRVTSWSNAEATPLPLIPNLINPKAVIVRTKLGAREFPLERPPDSLFDGKSDPPAEPWLNWSSVAAIDSGWSGSFSLEIDTFRTLLRVTAITLVEDPAHPESWVRDAKLEYWNPAQEKWVFAQYLTSDAPIHTHKLDKPIDAARFRLARPDGDGWPQSNLRLGEIVLHGETLGASHPDVIANKPVAVLYDEHEDDLASVMAQGGGAFQHGGAYNGGSCIRVESDRIIGPAYDHIFGHAIPNWDFSIVEKPAKPGEYRWLQFAYKANSPGVRGLSVRVGPEWPAGGVIADVGTPYPLNEGFWIRQKVAGEPTTEWRVGRLDLWAAAKKDFRIRSINFAAVGGRVLFDQILLGRTEADLPAPKIEEKKDILDSDMPPSDLP